MTRRLLLSSLLLVAAATALAQPKQDLKNIDNMCGCFSVNFKYAETFAPDVDYKFHERENMNAVELVLPVEKSDTKVVMQHLLVINDTIIIKHWREEWVYESPEIYRYTAYRTWEKEKLPASDVKGKWTQTVWEVGDEPRYQGVSAWINNDGATYWESTVDAPLPRREYSVRSDYNILNRRNRIIMTEDGYIHEQDNSKIQREGKKDALLAQEKGYNTYVKRSKKDCKKAEDWWEKNEAFWSVVRTQWADVLAKSPTLNLKWKVDDKMMHEHLDKLWSQWRKNEVPTTEVNAKVKAILDQFVLS